MSTFITSDTHFGDELMAKRLGFSDAIQMDNLILENWNAKVADEDTVYHLGDFGNFNKVSHLRGNIFLIRGNHDGRGTALQRYVKEMGFTGVTDNPVVFDGFYFLSHEPMYVDETMPYANVFGHVHSNPNYKRFSSRGYNACIEVNHYTPVKWEYIKRLIEIEALTRGI